MTSSEKNLTVILCRDGEPIGNPIPVGKFEPHGYYADMLAYSAAVRAPYRVEVWLTRCKTPEEMATVPAKPRGRPKGSPNRPKGERGGSRVHVEAVDDQGGDHGTGDHRPGEQRASDPGGDLCEVGSVTV